MEHPVQRLLPKKAAAKYVGQPPERFARVCPARPIKLTEADHPKYDVKDLDDWIDSVKRDKTTMTHEDILGRL